MLRAARLAKGVDHAVSSDRRKEARDLAVPADRLSVVDERFRVLEQELHHPPSQAGVLLLQNSVAADEGAVPAVGLARLDREAEPGLQHVVVVGDVVAEMAERLFDAAGIHGVQAAELQAVIVARLAQSFEHMRGLIGGHVKLPPQFADIGDPMRPGEAESKAG